MKEILLFLIVFLAFLATMSDSLKRITSMSSLTSKKVLVAGATGYIGRQVVKELVALNVPTIALVRSLNMPDKTKDLLTGAEIIVGDVTDAESMKHLYSQYSPSSTICCLASRSGVKRDAWLIDYTAGLNLLKAQETVKSFNPESVDDKGNFVLLSAFCCGKPLLQFQFAKIELENQIKASKRVNYSIVRPTAFFKSVDGQVESIRKGYPSLFFGDGTCAANPISETDLAQFLVACALQPDAIDMLNTSRDIGGPDVPAITKRQQIGLIYDALAVPEEQRKFLSLPVAVLDFVIGSFSNLESIALALGQENFVEKFGDATEIAKIVRYYATEPMVATGPGEVQGKIHLRDHFRGIAARGGQLEEVDKMTTTTGVLELFTKNEYLSK